MQPDEWVRLINTLINKTRDRRLTWRAQANGRGSQALVGEFVVVFQYQAQVSSGSLAVTPGSLNLALCHGDGRVIESLSDTAAAGNDHPADEVALRSLLQVILLEPQARDLADFQGALDDL